MLNRIGNLATKEIIQLIRDWLMLVFIILGPVLELILLAQSTGQGVTDLSVVVVDQDRSQTSRQIIAAIDNTEELKVVAYVDSPDQVAAWLDGNRAVLAAVLPTGLENDLVTRLPSVQLIVDGSNSISGSYALSAASGAISSFMARRATESRGGLPALKLRTQVRYNPTLSIRQYTVTAQLGFIVYQVTLMVSALGLARERELGTLEQLLVTPFRRLELLVGKAIPAMIVAGVDFVIMWAVCVSVFGVPMRGSFALLLGLSLLFIAAEIGWGLTISAWSRTQQQAVLLVFVLALIDISFSGYLVPADRMPPVMQMLSQLFPMHHYLNIIRSVMLKGSESTAVIAPAVALVALGIGAGTVAMLSLRRRLD
jgi:ABC-2 type transport system permease protein